MAQNKHTSKAARVRRQRIGILCAAALLFILAALLVIPRLAHKNHKAKALDSSKTYTATMEIANYGTVIFQLNQKEAPITCANFVELANKGFYNGLTFHRILNGYIMQGGDPNGNGTGGSDHTIKGEFTENGVNNPLTHTRGAVAMARSSAPDSASCQFYICQNSIASLDGKYAVFAYVTSGMNIVDAICADANPTDNNGSIRRSEQPVITSLTVTAE